MINDCLAEGEGMIPTLLLIPHPWLKGAGMCARAVTVAMFRSKQAVPVEHGADGPDGHLGACRGVLRVRTPARLGGKAEPEDKNGEVGDGLEP